MKYNIEVSIITTPINGWTVNIIATNARGKRFETIHGIFGDPYDVSGPKQWIVDHVFEIMIEVITQFEHVADEIEFYHNCRLVSVDDYEQDYYDWLDDSDE